MHETAVQLSSVDFQTHRTLIRPINVEHYKGVYQTIIFSIVSLF